MEFTNYIYINNKHILKKLIVKIFGYEVYICVQSKLNYSMKFLINKRLIGFKALICHGMPVIITIQIKRIHVKL